MNIDDNYPIGIESTIHDPKSPLYEDGDELIQEYRDLVECVKLTGLSLEEAQRDHKESLDNLERFEQEYGFE